MDNNQYSVKQELKSDIWLIVIIIATLISAFVIYGRLPDSIPTHWGINGQVDGWGSKGTVFLMPILNIMIYALMLVVPLIDPRHENYSKFKGAYRVIRAVTVIVFTVIYVATMLPAMGYKINVSFVITFILSLMFLILGSYMGKIKHNYFVGIRTPWTLADESVWAKTHQLGGRLFIAAGIISIIGSFIGGTWSFVLMMGSIAAASIIAVVYSYIIYSRSHKSENPG